MTGVDYPVIVRYLSAFVFTALAVATDIKEYKIRNKYVLFFITAGLLMNAVLSGFAGLLDALAGMLIPLILLPLFFLRMLGAGDIKAFCAVGSIVGLSVSVRTMLLSFLAGGVIATGFMLFRRNARSRMKQFALYVRQCVLLRSILPYDRFADEKSKFRFAFGIFVGYTAAVILRLAAGAGFFSR